MFSKDKKARESLQEIERRFDALEHDFKMLKLEWEESYEKIASMLRKLGRRAEAAQKEADGHTPLSPSEQALADNMSDSPGTPGGLTPRQSQAQRLILSRRRANGILPPTG